MTMLTKIGNSQGIRIPKPLIKQAKLEDVEIDLEVTDEGLLLKPRKNISRNNWTKNIENTISKNKKVEDKAVLNDMLNDSDLEDYTW